MSRCVRRRRLRSKRTLIHRGDTPPSQRWSLAHERTQSSTGTTGERLGLMGGTRLGRPGGWVEKEKVAPGGHAWQELHTSLPFTPPSPSFRTPHLLPTPTHTLLSLTPRSPASLTPHLTHVTPHSPSHLTPLHIALPFTPHSPSHLTHLPHSPGCLSAQPQGAQVDGLLALSGALKSHHQITPLYPVMKTLRSDPIRSDPVRSDPIYPSLSSHTSLPTSGL